MKKTHEFATILFRISIILSLLIVITFSPGPSKPLEDSKGTTPPQFEIAGSQVLNIHCSVTGQDYVLHVNLPQHYNDTTFYPVVYVLDSQWDFPLITAIYGDQYYDGFMPGTIIVGITWGGENPNYDTRRAFDLTPTNSGQPTRFGNAEKFLSFIKTEVIPFVDSKYRTNKNDRSLLGHSFGGLFTLYALFNEPDLFNKYVPGSPAWMWDNASLYKYLDKFSKTNLSHAVRVYAFVGEYEDVPGFEKLAEAIRNCKVKDLELETQIVKGSGHAGTKPEGYNRGLQKVFKRPCIKVDQKVLNRYVGEYQIDQTKIGLAAENGQLVAILPDNSRINLCAESEVDFYVTGALMNAHIMEDKNGKIIGFQMERYNESGFFKKVK